jgi:hypothetical protein
MSIPDHKKMMLYQLTDIFSMLFALIGFSYKVWRRDVTEQNSNIRTASFEMLLTLASLEQLVYGLHYDKNDTAGTARDGWVKVGLIEDLSMLTPHVITDKTHILKITWNENWGTMIDKNQSAENIVAAIHAVRVEISNTLQRLE